MKDRHFSWALQIPFLKLQMETQFWLLSFFKRLKKRNSSSEICSIILFHRMLSDPGKCNSLHTLNQIDGGKYLAQNIWVCVIFSFFLFVFFSYRAHIQNLLWLPTLTGKHTLTIKHRPNQALLAKAKREHIGNYFWVTNSEMSAERITNNSDEGTHAFLAPWIAHVWQLVQCGGRKRLRVGWQHENQSSSPLMQLGVDRVVSLRCWRRRRWLFPSCR